MLLTVFVPSHTGNLVVSLKPSQPLVMRSYYSHCPTNLQESCSNQCITNTDRSKNTRNPEKKGAMYEKPRYCIEQKKNNKY